MFRILTTAMKLFKQFCASSCLALSLAAITAMQTSCDSSSGDEGVVNVGVWTLNTTQFESGEYKFNLRSTYGPDIELIPVIGGTAGVMRVGGASTPVNFVYMPEETVDGFPSTATLEVTFQEPSAQSMLSVLAALGVRVLPAGEGETNELAAGASITFIFGFTPYTSVQTQVFARPDESFNAVRASWTTFEGLPTADGVLGAWVLLDMLQTEFKVIAINPIPVD